MAWVAAAAGAGALAAGAALVLTVAFLVAGVRSGPVEWGQLLTTGVWDPSSGRFGALAMIWGSGMVAGLALVVAAPIGWCCAVAINEVAPRRWRRGLRAGCELLAVVPSIVYGLVGLVYVRPLVARLTGVPSGDGLVTAGLVLAVMVLPTIVALSVDALASVPSGVREAAAACGLNRTEVTRSAVLPYARRGMAAALLLALARALGETIAVFLLVGRADSRLPTSIGDALSALTHPGQTLTTKLNGPEVVLAGTSGRHWATLCALGALLLLAVAALTVAGQRRSFRRRYGPVPTSVRLRGARRHRAAFDRTVRTGLLVLLAAPFALVAGIGLAVLVRGTAALSPAFWWSAASGASGGGVRGQLVGTVLLVGCAGLIAAPVGLGLGLVVAEYARPGLARWLRTLTLTLGGVPSILLGLWGYWLFTTRLGWGRSWLAGAVVLAVVAVPVVVVAVAAAAA
ncbi:MAG TPA: ABC transporter permease subunit, partial [Acidimicrobiales bacterium]|nr:ABC transporter permease subunit [Acidimicrobiales bacterium]